MLWVTQNNSKMSKMTYSALRRDELYASPHHSGFLFRRLYLSVFNISLLTHNASGGTITFKLYYSTFNPFEYFIVFNASRVITAGDEGNRSKPYQVYV